MSKVLIVGANGQLGSDICDVFSSNFKVIPITHEDLEVSNSEDVKKVLSKYKPDIVINTAAFHKTEQCEIEPEKSFAVNALGAFNLARQSKNIGAITIYISTNYVFDGSKKVYKENDMPNPINIYGSSKLAGENLTRIGNPNSYIIRTSGLFGINKSGKGHNFVTMILDKSRNENPKVVNDEFSSFTYTLDLANKLKELVDKNANFGVYHITNAGNASWFSFSEKIIKFGKGKYIAIPISRKDRNSVIERPVNSALTSINLQKSKISMLRPWTSALKSYIKDLNNEAT